MTKGNLSVVLISGPKGSGKTSLAMEIAGQLAFLSLECKGFFQLAHGQRAVGEAADSYQLCCVKGQKQDCHLVRKSQRWEISPDFFQKSLELISPLMPMDFVFMDEIGQWELKGGGHVDALAMVQEFSLPLQLFVCCSLDALPVLCDIFPQKQIVMLKAAGKGQGEGIEKERKNIEKMARDIIRQLPSLPEKYRHLFSLEQGPL